MGKLTEEVDFGFIRYANCWEDADLLLAGLQPKPDSKILSIGSAGDNSFSLLSTRPKQVVAIDVSAVQLHLIRLKKACFERLTYEQMLAFLGFAPSTARREYYLAVRPALPEESARYWDSRQQSIEAGIIYAGKFERYLQYFGRRVLPWIHSSKDVKALFEEKHEEAQRRFYEDKWNSWRWRLFFKIFFSRFVLGRFGRDPKMLREVDTQVGEFIFRQAEKHLSSRHTQQNYFLRYMLLGDFGTELPHYMRRENFDIIKQHIDRLHIRQGFAEEACQSTRFDYFNLSNIFEYMDKETFAATASRLLQGAEKGGRMAYWNLMVPRRISAILPQKAAQLEELSASLKTTDKGFFYNSFITEEII